ncbi:MAG: TonB-dependent receptor [Candidatus Zixiibacteriota bacterium]
MKRFILITALLLLRSQAVNGMELTGTVVTPDRDPLSAVSVYTDVTGIGAVTNEDGVFYLSFDEKVRWITFSSVGYQYRQFNIDKLPDTVVLKPMYYRGEKIIVSADRAEPGVTPIAYDNFSQDEIERDYLVGEFPLLLESTPNLYTYSDAGTPLGYSYVKIRGFDDKRIVTYINGVPLNDPEDQATYFVDLPDFAASITDIQIQRGVGNSLYGDASFGGALNIVTNSFSRPRKTTFSTGYGVYTSGGESVSDIYKQSIEYSSGLIDGRWLFSGRFSKQKTGGYRHNSWYEGWAYYFSVARLDPRMTTELHIYGGPMRMHLAYYGVGRETLEEDRRANPGIPGYEDLTYDNATDNFNQPHYQLQNRYKINEHTTLSNTWYYIRGKGYYEQLKPGQDYEEYNIDASLTGGNTTGDLVRQKWVTKNQYGWNPRLDIDHSQGRHSLGGSFYYFSSDHWGQVVWAQHITGALNPRHKYYQYFGKKYVASVYGQEYYRITDRVSTQITAQLRYNRYSFDQVKMGAFKGYDYDVDWLFFSPRLGLSYNLANNACLFFNFGVASRTPIDEALYDADKPDEFPSLEIKDSSLSASGEYTYEFGDPTTKPERLYDFEVGAKYRTSKYTVGINLFYMDFDNEILQYDAEGEEVFTNIDGSFHSGIELTAAAKPHERLTISGNFAYNYNRIKDYQLTYSVDSVVAPGDTVTLEEAVNFDGKTLPNFPEFLGNVIVDYRYDWLRLTYRGRLIGQQYADLWNIEELSIDPFFVSSVSASLSWKDFLRAGRLTLTGRIDNLFDKKYETTAAYALNWASRDPGQIVEVGGWAAYYVAPERSFYAQLKLELF